MRIAAVSLVSATLAGASGCDDAKDSARSGPEPSPTISGTQLHLPTNDWTPGQFGMQAGISGPLAIDQRHCLYLSQRGLQLWPVWPAGYTASLDSGGHVSLFDPDGSVVATDRDYIETAGGYITLHEQPAVGGECLPIPPSVAYLQGEVKAVAR
jgi:hypothetical protein